MSQDTGCGCGCGCSDNASNTSQTLTITPRPQEAVIMNRTEIQIQGMTCGHCVASVTEELKEIPGVENVDVILVANGTSTATVTSAGTLEETAIRAAVEEAGYDTVGISR